MSFLPKSAYIGKEKANRMRDIQEELARLREKLQRLESRASTATRQSPPIPAPTNSPASIELPPWDLPADASEFEHSLSSVGPAVVQAARGDIDLCLSGQVVQTPLGSHFETETLYAASARHGYFDLCELNAMPGTLIQPLCAEHAGAPVHEWAFLDTETTGLAGGAGTFAFLIGVGFVTEGGFLVRQYFLREPKEEASVLFRLAEDLGQFRTLVTFNGRTFDAPLLETRYRLARSPVPFEAMPHLDLLHACRRLWRLRFDSCKLTYLESQILGHDRIGDVPGFLIPALYTNYLRSREAGSLVPVFTHNALDILSLACLTSVVAAVFAHPAGYRFRHGSECIGLGRWLLQSGRREEALDLFRKGINTNIPEDLLARTLWDIAQIERKAAGYEQARDALEQIVHFPNALHTRAMEALSILYEHRLKDLPRALHYARRLHEMAPGEKTGGRIERLVKKIGPKGRTRMFEVG